MIPGERAARLSARKKGPRRFAALEPAKCETRPAKGISQEKLAPLEEVDWSCVGRVERGDNKVAALTLARLASALYISVAKLIQKAGL